MGPPGGPTVTCWARRMNRGRGSIAMTAVHARRTLPLWATVLLCVVLGAVVGVWAGPGPIVGRFGTEELGRLGMLVIRVLKALAVPLVLFTILDAILRH